METNKEKRKAMNDRYCEILYLMLDNLMDLLKGDDLTGEAKLSAVKMLDAVRHELNIDHRV